MTASLETERKYALDADAALPSLASLPGLTVRREPMVTLEATYLDTADLRLLGAGLTLRRRRGGSDAGWHLKIPAPGESASGSQSRTEVRVRTSRNGGVPASLARLVVGIARGGDLAEVARVTTRREILTLDDETGTVLAEVADDRVTAEALTPGGSSMSWREVEVELKAGEAKVLDQVEEVLFAASIHRSPDASKLARVLGSRPAAEEVVTRRSSAGAVAVAYLRSQITDLMAWDPEVRRDTEDSIHKARVATRRLRSALRTFGKLFEVEAARSLRDELKWLAGVLGQARDREVMRDQLLGLVADLPPELVVGPVQARLESELGGGYRAAHRAAVKTMSEPRYFALLDALEAFVAKPPFTELAAGKASRVLPRLVGKTWRRVHKLADEANVSGADPALHEVRKAAKQARYAGESLESTFGRDAERYAVAMEDLQEVLGEHQDAVVTRDVLRDMGVRAHLAGENAFTYGFLAGLEQARGDQAREAYADVLSDTSRHKVRRWLSG